MACTATEIMKCANEQVKCLKRSGYCMFQLFRILKILCKDVVYESCLDFGKAVPSTGKINWVVSLTGTE